MEIKTLAALIQSKTETENEYRALGHAQAIALIEQETDYTLLCKLQAQAAKWARTGNYEGEDYIELLEDVPGELNKLLIDGFYSVILDINAALAALVVSLDEVQS